VEWFKVMVLSSSPSTTKICKFSQVYIWQIYKIILQMKQHQKTIQPIKILIMENPNQQDEIFFLD
jgi:hypothetical protein